MAKLHFQDILNEESIDAIRKDGGFRNALPLEKFIMNFEVLAHIHSQHMTKTVLKRENFS